MKRSPIVLLTGFEPFGDWARNVTSEAVLALDGLELEGARLVGRVLPVAYPRAVTVLERALAEVAPDAVVAFGIHSRKTHGFRVESIGANELDFRIPDNDGKVRTQEPIDATGPKTRASTLDTTALVKALRAAGLRARHSRNAGRYLCNAVFYSLLGRTPRGAFVHVPPREPGEDAADVFTAAKAAARVAARAIRPEARAQRPRGKSLKTPASS